MRKPVQTYSEPGDVDRRLDELCLKRQSLIAAGSRAVSASLDAGSLMPATAAGLLAYLHGVEGLRVENLGSGWTIFRKNNLEGIVNDDINAVVLFQNVDLSCGNVHPQPRSPKGTISASLNAPSLFERYDVEAPELVIIKDRKTRTYYLMVDPHGGMELSLPVIEDNGFTTCAERIFLIEGGDGIELVATPATGPAATADDLVIEVKHKNER